MKNIYKKIDVSPYLLVVFFIAFTAGLFKDMLTFFSIIVVYEKEHVITSSLYKWKIKKISFGICGGFITYDEMIDKPLKEEFLISISGLLMQTLFYLICFFLYKKNILDEGVMVLIQKYHFSVFLFNLLPIIPLDGSKIISVFLNVFIPYKKASKILCYVSFFMVLIVTLSCFIYDFKIEYSYVMIFAFLIKKLIAYWKDIPHLFNRFLFERYACPVKSKKTKILNGTNLEKIKRRVRHVFLIKGKYYNESYLLSKKFD